MSKSTFRYKPLYKKFIRLRKNVQNRKKVTMGAFKKKKWDNLNVFLNRLKYRRKKNFRVYDLTRYHIQRYGTSSKRKFLFNLLIKQRLSLFYGLLKDSYFKMLLKTGKSKCLISKSVPSNHLIKSLEARLDTVLYRSHFVKSIREARLIIQHGHISVNSSTTRNNRYYLQKGDLIEISSKYSHIIKKNILSSNLWPLPPIYLMVNYRTFTIIHLNKSQIGNFSGNYPFFPNFNSVINYHKYQ